MDRSIKDSGVCAGELIKAQHDEIVDVISELNTKEANTNPNEYARILSKLIKKLKVHFDTEVQYMAGYRYPDTEQHVGEHKQFIYMVSTFNLEFCRQVPTDAKKVYLFLMDKLMHHEIHCDRKYERYIAQRTKIQ